MRGPSSCSRATRGQDFISERYFHLLRNYRRHGWIVLYLFGVSPVVCNSFLRGRNVTLPRLSKDTSYEPYATQPAHERPRLSQPQPGRALGVGEQPRRIRARPHARDQHAAPAVREVRREGRTANIASSTPTSCRSRTSTTASSARSAWRARARRPTKALRRAGVEYVEVRALDVSAFDPVGVNQNKLRFLEVFLALCLMKDSPPIGASEQDALDANHVTVARRGREPGLTLQARRPRRFRCVDWARELLDSMQGIAEVLDRGDPAQALSRRRSPCRRRRSQDVALTPSARMLRGARDRPGNRSSSSALRMSRLHKEYFLALYPPTSERQAEFRAAADESLGAQTAIEAADQNRVLNSIWRSTPRG